MKKDNMEAVKSSLLAGVASGVFFGGLLYVNGNPHYLCFGAIAYFVGTFVGLITTIHLDE